MLKRHHIKIIIKDGVEYMKHKDRAVLESTRYISSISDSADQSCLQCPKLRRERQCRFV